jgi:centromeric protein E
MSDHVFGPDIVNTDIFDRFAKDVILNTLDGYNGTIFAYGQTSSGKTHTMSGSSSRDGVFSPGIIHIGMNALFSLIGESGRAFEIRASYLEIYNEVCVPIALTPSVIVSDRRVRQFYRKCTICLATLRNH